MRKTSEAWRNGQLLRRADRSFGVKAFLRFRALKYPRKSGVAHLISFEDHHFAGCDESPFTVSLVNDLKSSAFDRRELLSVGTSDTCNCPRTINRRDILRNKANLLDRGDLVSRAGFCHLTKEALHLSPPFDQRSINANVIGILIPKVVQSADIPSIKTSDCLIHHASNGPFVLLVC